MLYLEQTCEEFAVLLLNFLRTFKLLLGMFLRNFVPQINRIFLFPVNKKKTVLSKALGQKMFSEIQSSIELTISITSLVLQQHCSIIHFQTFQTPHITSVTKNTRKGT